VKQTQNDKILGSQSIGRLLAKLSIPATVAMLVMGLYNVVDTIFIGRGVGTEAIGGLTIAFPFQIIVMAFAGMIGFGTASVVSRNLGSGNRERAYRAAGNAFTISVFFGLVAMVLGYTFLDPILRLFGATPVLIAYAREYLSVILTGTVLITFSMATNNIVRAEGRATVAMITMVLGAVTNIILDPIFIFGLKMGIRGAALATVISQFLSAAFLLYFYTSGRSSLSIRLRHLRPEKSVVLEIFALGVPAFIRQGGASLVVILVNNALGRYGGDIYISVFGVVFRIMHFVLMPLMGLVQGFQPITGYNYGAGNIDRVKRTIRFTLLISTMVAAFGFLILALIPGPTFRIFSNDIELITAGLPVLRVVVLIIPFVGIQMIGASYFQAVGKARPAFFLGLSRQFIFLLPLIIVLPRLFGLWGVFAAYPAADFLSTLVTSIWLWRDVRCLSAVPAVTTESRRKSKAKTAKKPLPTTSG
jgi:putative MATE family efflux protein